MKDKKSWEKKKILDQESKDHVLLISSWVVSIKLTLTILGIYFHRWKKKGGGICIPQLLKSLSNLVETLSQTLAQALLIGGFSDAYIMANEGFLNFQRVNVSIWLSNKNTTEIFLY